MMDHKVHSETQTYLTGLKIRPANHADYVGVLDINRDIYDGFDYLPHAYHWMLHTKDSHPYVGVIGGKVVGMRPYASDVSA